jgi:hypothetical protein
VGRRATLRGSKTPTDERRLSALECLGGFWKRCYSSLKLRHRRSLTKHLFGLLQQGIQRRLNIDPIAFALEIVNQSPRSRVGLLPMKVRRECGVLKQAEKDHDFSLAEIGNIRTPDLAQ